MKSCVIVGGADIVDYNKIKQHINKNDYFIYCDSGLKHLTALDCKPDLIVGDFDSYVNPEINVETIVLPVEKDDTDTFYAVKEALKRGFGDFTLIGVIGGRFDHSVCNVSILLYIDSLNLNAKIIDDYSMMEIISDKPAYIDDSYSYFSLLNITGKANGVTIKNAKFPLNNASINCDYQYSVSNEVLNNQVAEVSIKDGKLLLIKVY